MSQTGQTPASQKADGMYKSQLQEFCQRKLWPLPEYKAVKEGPLHSPHFKATVLVNGIAFETEDVFKRAKDAQIEAAKLALAYLSAADGGTAVVTSPPATGLVGASAISINLEKRPKADEIKTPVVEQQVQNSEKTSDIKRNKHAEELHIYKNQLQSVVLKKGYGLPIYAFESEGPPHNSRFKSKVTVNGKVYESPGFFLTLKESEHAAAKVALLSLAPPESQHAILDKFVFKNLLQELAQKSGMKLPIYNTTSSVESHVPTFVSTVLVDDKTFYGEEARTKKHAEMNAAAVAYVSLSQRNVVGPGGYASSINVPKIVSAQNAQPYDTSYLGSTNQLGGPSKLYSSQSDSGHREIDDNQESTASTDAIPWHLSESTHLSQSEVSSPPTPSDELNGSVHMLNANIFSGSSSFPRNVVRVYPRMPSMDFPAGAVVQHSDEKWVAVRYPASQTGH